MTRLFYYLLSTIAPSARFPGTWARLNRITWHRRPRIATLRAALPKPEGAEIRRRLSAALDRLAASDAAVNDAVSARLQTAGRAVQTTLATVAADVRAGSPQARQHLRAAGTFVESRLDAVDTVLRRYWSTPGEAPVVVAAAAATLAALVVGLVAQFPGSVAHGRTTAVRQIFTGIVSPAVAPQAEGASAAEAPPEEDAPPPSTVEAPEETAAPSTEPAAAAVETEWAPPVRGALPIGKGMWLYLPDRVEGGDPHAIVAKAKAVGLTHVYVRTGSSKMGFYAQDFLDQLLPVAHENGIRVYGWDFPYFYSWSDDVYRALEAIAYTTPDGHRIDGFSADIETHAEGTRISAHHAHEYGTALRRLAGSDYPLIATVPRPSSGIVKGGFPYAELAPHFDAFAPMVYWMQRDPATEVVAAMRHLSQFGRPVMPVGQAYDGGIDGGHPGVPSPEAIIRFMQAADAEGAPSVSFWSWQHADEGAWGAIHDAGEFRLAAGTPQQLPRGMVVAYQAAIAQHGFPVSVTGVWDEATTRGVQAYQAAVGLEVTGIIDEPTLGALLRPFRPATMFR